MNRLRSHQERAAEQAWHGSKITAERGFLVLRWSTEDVAKAMDPAGLTLEDLLAKHLVPRLEVTKTLCFAYRGQVVEKREAPDHDNQLEAAILVLKLYIRRCVIYRQVYGT